MSTTLLHDRPVTVGLAPLMAWSLTVGEGVLDSPATRRLRRLVGDRYTVTVSSTQVTSRRLVRRQVVRWAEAESVTVEPMAAVATRRLIGRTTRTVVRRAVPIPGLRWAATSLVERVADAGADLVAGLPLPLPTTLVEVRDRRGGGVVLDGPLALASVLSPGLTRAAMAEARLHGIPVEASFGK